MRDNFLEIKGLSCGYPGGFSLKSLNLTLPRGAFAGIIGRNGSGKSTLFKSITGDIRLTGGSVVLDSAALTGLTLKEKARRIATVTQFVETGPVTVREYVLMGRIPWLDSFSYSYSAADTEIAEKYMALTGLTELSESLVTGISGGELQLTAIASALTQGPSLLLLDEPTAHLDIHYQAMIMDMLYRLNREEGLTVLMIIHDLNLAGGYCDHLIMMNNGEISVEGTPDEVLTPENIRSAFGADVLIISHPITGKPVIISNLPGVSGKQATNDSKPDAE
ncbi:MAG: ABC transporter ATP-binding protein [Bacteroidales bacterium]|nr:ABC transporter ATP-binding protein [Bacteroidales bacterium]